MENLAKEDAMHQFLRNLRMLPYGYSVFFGVCKINDPIVGVHFFRSVPKEYLHSAELRDIMQFGSSNTGVFFKMRVAGVLYIFQFETKQGEEICVALQTHMNDVTLCQCSKARSGATNTAAVNCDIPTTSKPPNVDISEKRAHDFRFVKIA